MTVFQKKRREALEMILTVIGLVAVIPVIRMIAGLWCWCFDASIEDLDGLWFVIAVFGIVITIIGLWAVERWITAPLDDKDRATY